MKSVVVSVQTSETLSPRTSLKPIKRERIAFFVGEKEPVIHGLAVGVSVIDEEVEDALLDRPLAAEDVALEISGSCWRRCWGSVMKRSTSSALIVKMDHRIGAVRLADAKTLVVVGFAQSEEAFHFFGELK